MARLVSSENYRNAVKSVKIFPGADIESDHNPPIANVHLKLKTVKEPSTNPRLDVRKLQSIDVRAAEGQKNLHKILRMLMNYDKLLKQS